jgi:hypothetical protein
MKLLITSTLSNNVTVHEFNGTTVSELYDYLKENELYVDGMVVNGNTDLNAEGNDIPKNLKVVTVTPAKSSSAIIDYDSMSYNELKDLAKSYRFTGVENDDETLLSIIHTKYMSIPKTQLIKILKAAEEYLNPNSSTFIVSDNQVSNLSKVIDDLDTRVFEIEYCLQLINEANKIRFIERLRKDYPHLVK